MDSESKTFSVKNSEVNLSGINDVESIKTSEMQSDFVNILGDVNNSGDCYTNSTTTKNTSLVTEQNDIVSKTMQTDQEYKSMKLPLQVDISEATTSQDNIPSCSYAKEPNTSDQNKVKRGTSMETLGDNSDEDSSKRQKLSDSMHEEKNLVDDVVTFQKTNSKMRQRNYRRRTASDDEDSSNSTVHHKTVREASLLDTDEDNVASTSTNNESLNRTSETRQESSETSSDGLDRDELDRDELDLDGLDRDGLDLDEIDRDEFARNQFDFNALHHDDPDHDDHDDLDREIDNSNEWTTASEDEMDEDEEPECLKIAKPQPNFRLVPELMKRQIGCNPSFHKKYHGSLNVVERLKLLYELNEHQGCVNALNFNQKGNLLVSGSDDLAVVIWDWATGKKRQRFESGHCSNMFQAKWLPLDMESLMVTCGRDGQVRLLDLSHETSKKLATHHGPSHKLAVHNDTPHVIISVGEDAKVLSIDIRDRKPSKLLVIKEEASEVQLYSVHSNPFNSNEFCVAGRSHYVRIYDQRKVSVPINKLCPDHLLDNKYAHVTCAIYNYNGTEILASYNDEDIYLFDRLTTLCVEHAHRYQGHRNNATVKGVNFFGPKSEYVVSGSDCGNIFIWDKNTEAVVQWMKGDDQGVVNCLEGHPHIPVLATSGLDYNVKIWIPSDEESPKMGDFAKCVKRNARNRKRENEPDAFDGQMLWILLRHIRYVETARHRFGRYDSPDEENNDNYVSDGSTNNGNSWESDSEGDDVERLQCPPS